MLKSIYRFLSPKFQNLFLDYKVDFKPRKPSEDLMQVIEKSRDEYKTTLNSFLAYSNEFSNIKEAKNENDQDAPTWNNGFIPGLDIISLYGILREKQPQTYLEIGSGNSTKVARKSIKDGGLNTKIISIDPFPRANIDHLADEVIREPLENMKSHKVFETLKEGDILFIDNSHRCLPNSDVTVCFLEILPKLKTGVIVHIHDIYLPYDYPQFMCDRGYSEQYILAAVLLANYSKYQPILPNFFISEDKELREILTPVWNIPQLKNVERHGGSFWLRIGN